MPQRFINLYIMASVTLLLLVACDVGKAEHGAVEPNEETSIDRISPPTVPKSPSTNQSEMSTGSNGQASTSTSESTGSDATVVTVLNTDPAGSGTYAYEPSVFSFKVGDTVTFVNIAETELHSFTIDDLGIDVDIDGATTPGKQESVTITFDNPGVYALVCIYHEGNGMLGTITVE